MQKHFLVIALGIAALWATPWADAQVPPIINYQGRVLVGTVNYTGKAKFKFAFVNAAGTTAYWTNDGTHLDGTEPTSAVTIDVSNGLYSVLLGDTTLPNMTSIPKTVFYNSDVRLRVWFNDAVNGSQLLSPDQRVAAVGYAFGAAAMGDTSTGAVVSTNGNHLNLSAPGGIQLNNNVTESGNITANNITVGPGDLMVEGLLQSTYTRLSDGLSASFPGRVDAQSFGTTSDRNAKEQFRPVNARKILSHLVSLPIETWNFKQGDSGVQHIGPMAQDFYAAFQVGPDDKHIAIVDADGVAFAAIQGLNEIVQEQSAELASKAKEIAALEKRLAEIEKQLNKATAK